MKNTQKVEVPFANNLPNEHMLKQIIASLESRKSRVIDSEGMWH